jgi:hypothetical protein
MISPSSQFFGFGAGGLNALILEQRSDHISEHRLPMTGGSIQF